MTFHPAQNVKSIIITMLLLKDVTRFWKSFKSVSILIMITLLVLDVIWVTLFTMDIANPFLAVIPLFVMNF